ncbi:P-loop NTPase fold protein [Sphaerisporangium sp. B11E5]|uniref:P-loop NTPase fold protein n=1 Tax=Sphaerisporangium sp. B11E5 TaxID=3153563 RepID=UPI00325E9CE3
MTENTHGTTPAVVAFDPEGEYLVIGHGSTAVLWNPASGRVTAELPGHQGVITDVACGGGLVAVATDAGEIRLWDAGGEPRETTVHPAPVWSVAVSADGAVVAGGGDDGTVLLLDADTHHRLLPLTGHQGPVWSVALSPDDTLLASGGDDMTIKLHGIAHVESQIVDLPRQPVAVLSVAFSPDGTTLAAGLADGHIVLSGARTGSAQLHLTGYGSAVWAVAFSPDRRLLASGGDDRAVRIWDTLSGEPVATLTGHTEPVRSLAFAPDGVTLASGGEDVRLWNVEDGRQIGVLSPAVLAGAATRWLPGYDSDLPSEDDLLGVRDEVMPLAMLAAAKDLSPPLAVALVGEWGIGKSSAMLQMKRYVAELAEGAAADAGNSVFVSNVRQVWFNAWHYSDDHIWPGIVEHLFACLREGTGESRDADAGEEARSRAELRARLDGCEELDKKLTERLDAVDRSDDPPGVFAALGSPVTLGRTLFTGARQIVSDARLSWRLLLAWAVLAGAGYAAWVAARPVLAALTPVVAVLLAPALVVWRRLAEWHRSGLGLAGWHRDMLEERRRQVRTRMARLREDLVVADAAARLEDLLAGVEADGTYRPYRGLVGQVHHDLARISAELEGSRRQWREGGAQGEPPLERIVLYIDDLDRCHPKLVVEVLAAVHLLMALPLFVVVVGVDSQWLIRSVERHLDELTQGAVSPADYLDKIFQIPLRLSPPAGEQAAAYVRRLLPAVGSRPPVPAPAPGDPDVPEVPGGEGTEAARRATAPAPPSGEGRGGAQPDDAAALPEEVFRARPEGLRLTARETASLAALAALLGNPRKMKKLVNLYRLVRVTVPPADIPVFLTAPYHAAQVLLLLLVGMPEQAGPLYARLLAAAPHEDAATVLAQAVDDDPALAGDPGHQALLNSLTALLKNTSAPASLADYHPWCTRLRRYSFHDQN